MKAEKCHLDTCIYLESVSRLVTSDQLWPSGLQPTRFLCPWDSPGMNTGVDCHTGYKITYASPSWGEQVSFSPNYWSFLVTSCYKDYVTRTKRRGKSGDWGTHRCLSKGLSCASRSCLQLLWRQMSNEIQTVQPVIRSPGDGKPKAPGPSWYFLISPSWRSCLERVREVNRWFYTYCQIRVFFSGPWFIVSVV